MTAETEYFEFILYKEGEVFKYRTKIYNDGVIFDHLDCWDEASQSWAPVKDRLLRDHFWNFHSYEVNHMYINHKFRKEADK